MVYLNLVMNKTQFMKNKMVMLINVKSLIVSYCPKIIGEKKCAQKLINSTVLIHTFVKAAMDYGLVIKLNRSPVMFSLNSILMVIMLST